MHKRAKALAAVALVHAKPGSQEQALDTVQRAVANHRTQETIGSYTVAAIERTICWSCAQRATRRNTPMTMPIPRLMLLP